MWSIGNGQSRVSIDINQLDGPKVGCNAIWRDYSTDHLICCDKRMMNETLKGNVNTHSIIYTREDWYDRFAQPGVRKLPPLPYEGSERADEPFHWGSGSYAVLVASMFAKEGYVNLIGFDLYSDDKLVNNIYKDTPNYSVSSKRAVDPRYWVHQTAKIFKCFPKLKFTIYQLDNWELPKAWNYPNVLVDTISNIRYNSL
jgi:hypothetical protein